MAFKSQLIFAVAVSNLLIVAFSRVSSNEIVAESKFSDSLGSKYPLQLKYLGVVGGKAYFVDDDLANRVNWEGALAYCESYNLTLASIESRNQATFLIDALQGVGTHFWTSGRESRQHSMYVWNENGAHPESSTLNFTAYQHIPLPYYYCLALFVDGANFGFEHDVCTYSLRPLCQLETRK